MSNSIHSDRMADLRVRQARASQLPMPVIAHAHATEHVLYPEFMPADGCPRIHHPALGWGSVVMVNEHEFQVQLGTVLAWFKLDDPTVSQWPMENAADFARWVLRAA